MSPLPVTADMAPPPVAQIGHNSRIHKAAKEIEEVRAAYLDACIHANTPRKEEILCRAFASGMSTADFHALWGYLSHGTSAAERISVGQKRLGQISGRSERSIRSSVAALEEAGWLTEAKRHRREAATRSGGIPHSAMTAIISEIVERAMATGKPVALPSIVSSQDRQKSSGLHFDQDRQEASSLTQNQDRQDSARPADSHPSKGPLRPAEICKTGRNLQSRPAEFGSQENQKTEPREYYNKTNTNTPRAREEVQPSPQTVPDPATELVEGDFSDYNLLFNSWGRKPNDITPRIPHRRDFTDANLRGVLRGQAHRDQKLAISAIRNTITSMQSRTVLSAADRAVFGSGGFGAYFQKVLIDTLDQLERPRPLTPDGRQRCATAGMVQPAIGNIPPREADCPEHVWQIRLKRYVESGKATQEEAIAAGLKL